MRTHRPRAIAVLRRTVNVDQIPGFVVTLRICAPSNPRTLSYFSSRFTHTFPNLTKSMAVQKASIRDLDTFPTRLRMSVMMPNSSLPASTIGSIYSGAALLIAYYQSTMGIVVFPVVQIIRSRSRQQTTCHTLLKSAAHVESQDPNCRAASPVSFGKGSRVRCLPGRLLELVFLDHFR